MSTQNSRQAFLSSAEKREVGSAYLLVCSHRGVAHRLIDDFLMRLFCADGGCGNCADCIKVREGHVDILRLNAPKVDEFRAAIAFLSQKAVEGRWQAIIVEDADDMTDSAANSMLKTLESPPQGTVLLLAARSVSGVLPTIASRCAAIFLTPDQNAAATIAAQLGVDEVRAHILTDLSGGYISEARRLQEDEEYWPLREQTLHQIHTLLGQKGFAISAHAEFFNKNKDRIDMVLALMLSYCRDISVLQKTGNTALVANRDRLDDIRSASSHFTTGAISNMIRIILETQRRFLAPVNFVLAVEKMLFDILEELNKWKK